MHVHALLSLGLIAQIGAGLPVDSLDALRERARDAEARYERLSRQLAPYSWSGPASECDEVVGRFCLRFDSADQRPGALGAEHARSMDARREAIEALRRYFAVAPHEHAAAGPLVRLLVRDGRAREAASAAGVYAALSGDTLRSELLQAFALHHAGAGERAERHFVAGLARMTAREQQEWLDPSWLLHPDEQRAIRRMSVRERQEYERRFWLLADPLWMTPSNERWNEHVARHVEARLLAEAPRVAGSVRWGRDLDQLTVRYGTPVERARQGLPGSAGSGMVEYWDSAQRAYAPPRLSLGVPAQPEPGVRPYLYAAAARSAYALRDVARVIEPVHQVSRFMRGETLVLRVDAAVPTPRDSVLNRPGSDTVRAALIVYDSALTRRESTAAIVRPEADSIRWTGIVDAWRDGLIYSIELVGGSSRPAARARYAIDGRGNGTSLPDSTPRGGLSLSDILVTRPLAPSASDGVRVGVDARMRDDERAAYDDSAEDDGRAREDIGLGYDDPALLAFESLIFEPGDSIGLYAEVYGLTPGAHAAFEASIESAERPSLLGRLAGWIGRSVGLVEDRKDPRIGWHGEKAVDQHYVVAFSLPLPADRDGLHDLVLRVTDPVTGEARETRRRILLRR